MQYKNLIIISVLLIISFSSSVYAFSDNFEDGDISDWTVVSGSWNTVTLPVQQHIVLNAAGSAQIFHSIGSDQRHIELDVYSNQAAGVTHSIYWSGTSKGLSIVSSGATHTVSSVGFTIVPVTLSTDTWYHFNIDIVNSDTQLQLNITNMSGGVISYQQVAYSYVSSDNIRFLHGAGAGVSRYDNITTSAVLPSTTTSISWAATGYTVGSTASFTWGVSDTDWNSFNRVFIRLYKNEILQDWGTFDIGCLCSSQLSVGQSGTYDVYADEAGTYRVTLEEGILSYAIVDEDSTRINAQSSSYFLIPGTALIKTNIPVTYHIGIGGIQSGIEWFYLDNGKEVRERGITLGTSTDGTINVTFSKVGTYNVYLKSLTGTSQTFQMHTVITSFISGGTPTNNFSASDITLIPVNGTGGPGANYSMNDVLYGNYSIQGSVFSGEGVFFIDVYNNDAQTETATYFDDFGGSVGLSDGGLYAYLITNNANQVGKINQFIPGNNSIRLMVQNPNLTYTVLATEQFNVSRTNAAGYGLDVNPVFTSINKPVTAIVTVPSSLAKLEVTSSNGFNRTYNLAAGTTTITISFKDKGIYGYNLLDPSDNVQMTTQVDVGINPVPTVSPTPPITPMTSVNTMADNIFIFLAMPALWGLIIWVLLVYAVSANHKPGTNDPTALVAFILANIEAAIGFWAPFTFYVLAIVWLIAAIAFLGSGLGKQTTTGDK